nr:immunoglobulin light chain junction region [Macaca mulatta]MOV34181.1 immunoglobulin light chain junction region [Macaca mulatta]MOV34219.1 immunoglobulin light chain junction region [Macaca mulatta]MOV34256.1 immunoglobulin light chain junction region [Macaca mulatta]MOV34261.1 immunoglobulin light chain junction region [Macaca mulatta]
CMQDIQLPLTF